MSNATRQGVAELQHDCDFFGQATAYMHLTNYAVNKRNVNFQFNTDEEVDDEGSKWSLTALREWMESRGHDYGKVWRDICDIAVKTVVSIQPLLGHNYRSVLGYENEGFSCFEILGGFLSDGTACPILCWLKYPSLLAVCTAI
jgi:hypothetical protein